MKIAVINFSGNVGKSVIAHHLLAPRIPKSVILAVESINSNQEGEADAQVRGREFAILQETLMIEEAAIVDVGASNVEEFTTRLMQFRGSHETFDLFVIPVTPSQKAITDTVQTVAFLSALGIPRSKLRVILNMVNPTESIENTFAGLAKSEGRAVVDFKAAIHENELFARLRDVEGGIPALLDDGRDLKAEIAATSERGEKLALARRLSSRQLAIGVAEEMDAVFARITAPV